MDLRRLCLLLLLAFSLLSFADAAQMSRKQRRAVCARRPELRYCQRLAAARRRAASLRKASRKTAQLQESDLDDSEDGGDYDFDPFDGEPAQPPLQPDPRPVAPSQPQPRPRPVAPSQPQPRPRPVSRTQPSPNPASTDSNPFGDSAPPASTDPFGDGSGSVPLPRETGLEAAASGPATSADFCVKWTGHSNYFCRGARSGWSAKVRSFCDKYEQRCPRPPVGPAISSTGGVELIEEATPTPGGAIARLCAQNQALGQRFCLRGTPPAGFEERCRQFVQYCVNNGRSEEGPDPATLPVGGTLAQRCGQYRGIGQRFCTTGFKRKPEYEAFCFDYRKYCADVPGGEPRDFKTIANVFDSGIDIGDSFNVGGIPFYPFNPEGTIGVEDSTPITFGAWGGGAGTRQGVTDFWSLEEDVGANWYNGYYGQQNKFGVPMFGNLFSGIDESSVNVPIFDQKFGDPITVGDRFGFGPFVSTGDTVGVDWFGGGVSDREQVSVPFVGIGVNSGTSVNFPSVGSILGAIPLGADKEVVDQLIEDRAIRQAQLDRQGFIN